MRMQRSNSFPLILLFVAGLVLSGPSTPIRSRVRRQNMKVRINATGDTIVMKFLRPNPDTKLEGYILGYGSSMFSKQFIQLPENGKPYETEFDAEPKYLIAVQPIPANEVKKQCTGKVELEKPLHLVIGSVTPTSVLLSWGTLLKTPYETNIMNDCLEDGHYTVRYRERNRKWNYQTCPTSDTVIDNLKPNSVYEFGVQPNSKDGSGHWSKPVIHNISSGGTKDKPLIRKIFKQPMNPLKPLTTGPHTFPFAPRHVSHNRTHGSAPPYRNLAPKTTLGREDLLSYVLPREPQKNESHLQLSKPTKTEPHKPKVQSATQPFYNFRMSSLKIPEIKSTPQPSPYHQPYPLSATLIFTMGPPAPGSHPTPKPVQTETQAQPKIPLKSDAQTQPPVKPKPTHTSQVHSAPPQSKIKSQPKTQPPVKPTHTSQVHSAPPQSKIKSQPKTQPPVKPKPKPTHTSKVHSAPPQSKIKSQPKIFPNGQAQRKKLPKPQPKLQPSHQPQTRTDPVSPGLASPTAPSLPEEGKPLPPPALATEKASSNNQGAGIRRASTGEVPHSSTSSSRIPSGGRQPALPGGRVPPNPTRKGDRPRINHSSNTPGAGGVHHRGKALHKPVVWPKEKPAVLQPSATVNKRTNLVGKPSDHDKPMDLKQGDKESILKPFTRVTAKPKQERRQPTTTSAPTVNNSHFDISENSSVFRPLPASEVDIMGKKRFVAPHVIYKTDKKPDEPCSITSSLAYFPDEEGNDMNVTGPPRVPPSNVTVVTVEGCPSFVILDWQKSDNETREYEVVSSTKGPNGEEVSVLTTNQTHTAVENLKPESSYKFKVTPKNELGTGPSSEPVSFSTESADPRVSEYVAGKDAIWTQFPFKADAYSECSGKQYVKRTWYRKFVGIQLCNSLRYKIYLSDSLTGRFYNIGDQTGYGEDHCQFVDSFLDGRTGTQMFADQLQSRPGFYRALRQEPVSYGEIGGKSHITYVGWYECGTPIPGKW